MRRNMKSGHDDGGASGKPVTLYDLMMQLNEQLSTSTSDDKASSSSRAQGDRDHIVAEIVSDLFTIGRVRFVHQNLLAQRYPDIFS